MVRMLRLGGGGCLNTGDSRKEISGREKQYKRVKIQLFLKICIDTSILI